MPVTHPTRADVAAREGELPVATGAGVCPAGNEAGKVTLTAGAAVNGNYGDFTAGNADVERSMGIGTGHGRSSEQAAPPSPQIAAGWGYGVNRRPPADVTDAMGSEATRRVRLSGRLPFTAAVPERPGSRSAMAASSPATRTLPAPPQAGCRRAGAIRPTSRARSAAAPAAPRLRDRLPSS